MNSTALPEFIAFGEALTDLVTRGESSWQACCGGAPWNVARAVRTLGRHSAFGGAISSDVFGDALWQESIDSGLDMRFMQRNSHSPLLAVVHHLDPPSYFFVGDNAADLHFDPTRLPDGWDKAVRWAYFGGISLARPPLAQRLLAVAKALKASGAQLCYDPNFRVLMDQSYDPMLAQMCEIADLIKVSDEDLAGLFRTDDIGAARSRIRHWNPQAMVLHTHGADGATLSVGAQQWTARPPAIALADTVGAGDAAMAGLIAALLDAAAAEPAVWLRHSIAAGAAACTVAGAHAPSRGDINALLDQVVVAAA